MNYLSDSGCLPEYVEVLQVLLDGVHWCEGLSSLVTEVLRRHVGDAGPEEALHELVDNPPAVVDDNTGAVLHLHQHSLRIIMMQCMLI